MVGGGGGQRCTIYIDIYPPTPADARGSAPGNNTFDSCFGLLPQPAQQQQLLLLLLLLLWVSEVTLGIFGVQFWGFSVLQRHGVSLLAGDFFHGVFHPGTTTLLLLRPRQTQGGARQGIILLTLVSDYYRSRRSSSNYYYYYYYYYGFQKLR